MLRSRASWLEARARFKSSGELLPDELRTPKERIDLIDRWRRELAAVVGLLGAMRMADFAAALGAMRTPELVQLRKLTLGREGQATPDELATLDQAIAAMAVATSALLERLGILSGPNGAPAVVPFVVDLVER